MTGPVQYPNAGGWGRFVGPLVRRLNLHAEFGLNTAYSPNEAKALADLIRTMAARIDNPPTETMTVDQLLAGEFPPGFLNTGDAQ